MTYRPLRLIAAPCSIFCSSRGEQVVQTDPQSTRPSAIYPGTSRRTSSRCRAPDGGRDMGEPTVQAGGRLCRIAHIASPTSAGIRRHVPRACLCEPRGSGKCNQLHCFFPWSVLLGSSSPHSCCWPSQVFSMELVQELLEGLSSCPIGRRHGVKIDRRLHYRASSSSTINLPPPGVRWRCPELHDN
jgi:hypothetical protein